MPSAPSVVAIIAAYNEADIIDTVVGDLVRQDIQVYLLDDGSTDGTAEIVERYRGRGVIGIERLERPEVDGEGRFGLERIVCRKTQLAQELNADWFINHDADEFRESPWPGVSLRDGIAWVDRLGFNAIDFVCLNFWPDHDQFRNGKDVRDAFTRFALAAPYDRVQVRCWKKTDGPLDLVTTAGHEARFPARRVFPVRFILRHYPIRGQAHGERKVFHERQFLDAERERGWHVQYEAFREGQSFLHDGSALEPYEPDAMRLSLQLQHRGVEELDAQLGAARTELEARTHDLHGRDRDLDTLKHELETRRQALAAKAAEIDALTKNLELVRQEIEVRSRDLEQSRSELAATAGELSQSQEQLGRSRDEVTETRDQLALTRDELARDRGELATSRDELARTLDTLTRAHEELARTQDELARNREVLSVQTTETGVLRGRFDQQAADLARTIRELDARLAEASSLRLHIEECRGIIDRLQHACDNRGRELEAFRRSLSWRWTAPARAIYRLLWRP
jgi:glycosyltransferase involved in cell wall biosynthesis